MSTTMRERPRFLLYLITDEQIARDPARVAAALMALPRGAAAVQLRAKALDGRALLERAVALREVTREHGAALLVNGRLDVALAVGAEGVHLPAAGVPVAEACRVAPSLMIGASTHSHVEAQAAVEAGADFVTFGPVWATPSKAGMGVPVGVAALTEAARRLAVPVFALGGIDDEERAVECRRAGAGVACLRAVLGARDPGEAAARMWSALTSGR